MRKQASPLRIHILQHVPFEGPDYLERWVRARRHRLTETHFYRNDPLPQVDDIDWLIVMGGPMGVHDGGEFPWLKEERLFIEHAVRREKAVLGICLGAQLVAAALGANVYRNRFSEIGWLPVELTDEGRRCAIFEGFPKHIQVFQWHNDTFDLPAGAVSIARSKGCGCQAFLYGVRVLGLQFHFELTQKGLREFLKNVPGAVPEGPYVQDPRDMILPEKNFRLANAWMNEIMTRMERRVIAVPGNGCSPPLRQGGAPHPRSARQAGPEDAAFLAPAGWAHSRRFRK